MFAKIANYVKQWEHKKRYWRYYNSAQGDDFTKTCTAIIMMELDDKNVRKTAIQHPTEQRKKFLMAYECFVMWHIKFTVERSHSQEFVSKLVFMLRDNIRNLGQYEEGVFEEIWEALQDAMPNYLMAGKNKNTGAPTPWVYIVTECNAHGIELSHVIDFTFIIHATIMFKHVHEFVQTISNVSAKNDKRFACINNSPDSA
ncbi:MAG: hypothetical protein ABSB11_07840 [Sedimentisphaerales bacterium]|jgi:hypothetical protein